MISPSDEPRDARAEAVVAKEVDPHTFRDSVLTLRFERAARTFALDLATPLPRMGGLESEKWDAINETREGEG